MKARKRGLLLIIILLFSGLAGITVQKFHEVKNQYKSIEPSLDNYSTAEVLFLAFERTRTAAYKTEDPDAFPTQKAVFDAKLLILKNKYLISPSFYYEADFISALNNLDKQSQALGTLFDPHHPVASRKALLRKMDEMQPALIDLQQIIYRIQIRNFSRVKMIIQDNSVSAEISALAAILLLFMFITLLWVHITKLRPLSGVKIFSYPPSITSCRGQYRKFR